MLHQLGDDAAEDQAVAGLEVRVKLLGDLGNRG